MGFLKCRRRKGTVHIGKHDVEFGASGVAEIVEGLPFAAKTWEPAHLHIFDGPLFNPGITSAAIENSGTPTVQVKLTFSGAGGDGRDTALAVIYDEISQKAIAAAAERQHCQIIVPISSIDQADLSTLHAYLVFSQSPAPGTTEPGQVSSTTYAPVAVPAP